MEFVGNVILPDGILPGAKVICADGVITKILPNAVPPSENLPYIAPGFVDIHNHGALGHDYMDATPETFRTVALYLASRGITCAQCTTVSAPVAQLAHFMKAYRQYQQAAMQDCCRYVGIHIEGPYIAPAAKGAHPLETLLTPEKDGYGWILENSDIIGEVTVAPELPGMPQMIRDLTEKGIVISGGHDASEPQDVEAAAQAGMTHCTHIYCAMSTLHKTNGQRVHGLCEYAMTHDTITAEMIADNHHVPPLLAKMIHKAKGADKVCIVSDAISPAGLPESDQIYSLGTGDDCTRVRVEDGVAMVEDRSCYAGSIQALDQMVRNLVNDAQIPLVDAIRMATLTPAQVIGIDAECGSIAAGKRADLCLLDKNLQVTKTVIAGKVVFEREV
jgi:N-acetylglucosamine-6-phosphate deacetylase